MKKWISSIILCLLFFSNSAFPGEKPIFYESGVDTPCFLVLEEQRDPRFSKLLSLSLKISVRGASGSGTICHYDPESGIAHVISCGHLWSGNMEHDPKAKRLPDANVTVWHKNSRRLDSPETFPAEVLFWSNDRGYDVSLLRFRPDWEPEFAKIDENYTLAKGTSLNSMGCDGGSEVARYEVVFERMNGTDIITSKNSPRPGRSGGGLVNEHGNLVGVCWGTSDVSSGNGIGYFTPVSAIKEVFSRNGHGWLLELFEFKSIPIVDRDNPGAKYGREFIPFPAGS